MKEGYGFESRGRDAKEETIIRIKLDAVKRVRALFEVDELFECCSSPSKEDVEEQLGQIFDFTLSFITDIISKKQYEIEKRTISIPGAKYE